MGWFREVAQGGAWGDVAALTKRKGRKASPTLRDEEVGRVEVVQRARAVLAGLARAACR